VRLSEIKVKPNAVFLNIPYDTEFQPLYLAYIAGLIHLGFEPRATLGIPGGTRRLEKILAELAGCRYSVHDLSRVQLDRNLPKTPRFNMPFELGLAVTWAELNPAKHSWFVFEQQPYRIQKSLSDLNGTDPHLHEGRVAGVMSGLCNAFVRPTHQPRVNDMIATHRVITRKLAAILEEAGAETPFEARAFQSLCYTARVAAEKYLRR